MWRKWVGTVSVVSLLVLATASDGFADGLSDVRIGNEAFRSGDYEQAVTSYSQAILSGELNIEAMAVTFNNRGVVYGELGDFDRAISDYQEALALKPEDATTLKNLRVAFARRGQSFDKLGEPQRAIADYTQALEIDGEHVPTLQRRAQANEALGNVDAARTDYERIASVQPSNQEVRVALQRLDSAPAKTDVAEAQPIEAIEPAAGPAEKVAAVEDSVVEPTAEDVVEAGKNATTFVVSDGDLDKAKIFRAVSAVNFRSGPGNDFDRLGAIGQGDQVQVLGVDKGWMQVVLRNGQKGYIYEKWLQPVEPAQ